MSYFSVPVKRIRAIEPHPNASALDLAVIDGYQTVVRKGQFKAGDLVVYIPEGAVLPEPVLSALGLWDDIDQCGTLSGSAGNRVKAVRLRGELSQGICCALETLYPLSRYCEFLEESNLAAYFGITKYEPPIPVAMSGEVFNVGERFTLRFDVENWKAYPDILRPGEEVVFTEKLHGTCTVVAILPYEDAHPEAFGEYRNILIFSKGLGAKGLVLKNNERNRNNLYVRATRKLVERIDEVLRENPEISVPTFILGETYGPGVQDLAYGQELGFRVFSVVYGYRGEQSYKSWSAVEGTFKSRFGYETVPVLYRGPFSVEAMKRHTDGRTTLGADHVREGIVMVPTRERTDPNIGRVCLKSISADYLLRNGGSEYN